MCKMQYLKDRRVVDLRKSTRAARPSGGVAAAPGSYGPLDSPLLGTKTVVLGQKPL